MDREEKTVGSSASTACALPLLPTVRFFHSSGQANVHPELDALIRTGTKVLPIRGVLLHERWISRTPATRFFPVPK
jgi:hypothetical protein